MAGDEGPFLTTGEILHDPESVPKNPFWLAIVMVKIPTDPLRTVRLIRSAVRVKSGCGKTVIEIVSL